MNFLAHVYLSGDHPRIMVGNFIGDFVKGKNYETQFDSAIAKGIELHRLIDDFTDHHPVVQQSKQRLRPKYRHYAGVVVDIFYDHLLAKNWEQYHPQSLAVFAQSVYAIMDEHLPILPEQVGRMLPYMKKDNWLLNYSTFYGIEQSLNGMARRTPYESKMEEAVHELKEFHNEFNTEFQSFFPHLKHYAETFLLEHSSSL
jgi:acyl carrier protein phosphodiesterase